LFFCFSGDFFFSLTDFSEYSYDERLAEISSGVYRWFENLDLVFVSLNSDCFTFFFVLCLDFSPEEPRFEELTEWFDSLCLTVLEILALSFLAIFSDDYRLP
jgi:hypothetical protein